VRSAVSKHWELGGEGAEELARVVMEAGEDHKKMGTCMVKTHLSPSHDLTVEGRSVATRVA
jgi:formyltetrahydrofolate synthetase